MKPGDVFDRLTIKKILRRVTKAGKLEIVVEVRCACGTLKTIRASYVANGDIRSCGCLRREIATTRNSRHGQAGVGKKSALYKTWSAMLDRCRRSPFYVGRQINVCDEWLDFQAFEAYVQEHLGPKPRGYSLDRIDNDKDYEPGNVRYGSPKDQARNRRSNTLLTVRGETLCVSAWAERQGIQDATILQRLRMGWSDEDAVLKPLRGVRKRNL